MKLDKKLKKTINKLVILSFDNKGGLKEEKVQIFSKSLKSLVGPKAIVGLSEYVKGLKREMKKTTLEIESNLLLSQTEVDKVTNRVRSKYILSGVATLLNTSLLGGLKFKIGDMVFDDSVQNKIEQVKGAII